MKASTRILFDCRWLGLGGPGRAGELLLLGLKEIQPEGRWILWGAPEKLEHLRWQGAEVYPSIHSPLAMSGQRAAFSMPKHDVALYVHQIRPLLPGRSVTLIHDTIPLHFGSLKERLLKYVYFKAVAAVSTRIMTVSEFSLRSISRDLAVPPEKLSLVRYPVDPTFVTRLTATRQAQPPENIALYVGRFGKHKNLPRLINAFKFSNFAKAGGRLILAGGSTEEVDSLRCCFPAEANVDILGHCTQAELEAFYGTARLLVMPSLEEGFGLPVWEALSIGLPVCVSDRGSLPELVGKNGPVFNPLSLRSIAEAIDKAAVAAPLAPMKGPSLPAFAQGVLRIIEGTT